MDDTEEVIALLVVLLDQLAHDDFELLTHVVVCTTLGLLGDSAAGALLAIALGRVRWAVNKGPAAACRRRALQRSRHLRQCAPVRASA